MSQASPRLIRASSQHSHQHTSRLSPASTSAHRSTSPAAGSPLPRGTMPSPRSSPAMRPKSPLSPGFSQFEPLQAAPQRGMHSRTGSTQRRAPSSSLQLPSLPRFHPANFPSPHGSLQSTPDGTTSPQPPISPRTHQRMYSDVQKQLYFNHREILANAGRSSSSAAGKPVSPRLQPLGSPGPVTPLELEGEEYLLAGARDAPPGTTAQEFMDQVIREESRRQRNTAPTSARSNGR